MKRQFERMLPLAPSPVVKFEPDDRASVSIYKPYFTAGILSVLVAGCTLGAIALLGIALNGSYTASAWTPYVLAHANSQLYGWVGFFVMGFALQQHAPSIRKVDLYHRLAYGSLILMSLGIVLRFVAEPMIHVDPVAWVPVGVFSTILQGIAVMLFVANIAMTRHRSGQEMPWQSWFVFASLGYLLLIAFIEPIAFISTHTSDPMRNVMFVAEWFPLIREFQFLGFVPMMIFGVGLVKFNSCFGAGEANRGMAMTGFALWNAGLWIRALGWLHLYRSEMKEPYLYFFGGLAMFTGALCLISSTRVFGPMEGELRSQKFVRAAFCWLGIAGLMLVFEPVHLNAIGMPFSHAFTGAVRHAVTVGFISQMILGVGAHVVARMNGLSERGLTTLMPTFMLINFGNAARVGLEVATDYTPAAFLPMGITGFIELIGLVLWGGHLVSVLFSERFRKAAYAC